MKEKQRVLYLWLCYLYLMLCYFQLKFLHFDGLFCCRSDVCHAEMIWEANFVHYTLFVLFYIVICLTYFYCLLKCLLLFWTNIEIFWFIIFSSVYKNKYFILILKQTDQLLTACIHFTPYFYIILNNFDKLNPHENKLKRKIDISCLFLYLYSTFDSLFLCPFILYLLLWCDTL